jgi:hypothetical protein
MNHKLSLHDRATKLIQALPLFLLLLLLSLTVLAQSTASMSGTVSDSSKAAIPGATVTVRNLETSIMREAVTNAEGRYTFFSLQVGRHEIRVAAQGFKSELRPEINLAVGQTAEINFNLEVGQVSEAVTVNSEAPLIDTSTASTSGLVGEREVKDLPLNGRSFDNLITLNPATVNVSTQKVGGAATGAGNIFSISGRRPSENIFLLNGIEFTGASVIGETPGGVSGQLLGIDAIREFNVLTDTYAAEYGKRAGGQILIVTNSGANKFHGSAFEFLRNSALDARNFFDRGGVPPFKRNDFGFVASGPIVKNKAFVFGNYEGFRQRLGLSQVATVPDENARRGLLPDPARPGQFINVGLAPGMAPYFNLWPLPNGTNFGDGTALSFSNPKQSINENFFTVRLDQTFSGKDSLSGVYTFDDGNSITPLNNPFSGTIVDLRTQVLSLSEIHIFSPTLVNTARLGFSRAKFVFDNRPLVDLPAELSLVQGRPVGSVRIGGGVGSGATNIANAGSGAATAQDVFVARNLFTLSDDMQISHGINTISAGVWIQHVQSNEDQASTKNGQVIFNTLNDFIRGNASQLRAVLNPTRAYWRSWEAAWYVQDVIRLKRNLSLNIGLRHEFTNGWNEADGRAANFVLGPTGALLTQPMVGNSPLTKNNAKWLFAPRVALAWDPFGQAKTSVRAGFGVYYNLLDALGWNLDSNAPFNTQLALQNIRFPFQLVPGSAVGNAIIAPSGLETDLKTPTVIKWSLKVDQALGPNLAVSVGYVGSHGYRGVINGDLNTAIPTIRPDGSFFYPLGAPRRNPQLANSRNWISAGFSFYNALQVDVRQRVTNGLSFRANYTFSKSLDNGSARTSDTQGSPSNVLNPLNPRLDKALSSFDMRHRFSISGTYELPIGKGKEFLTGVKGAVEKFVSGWQLNGIVNLQSGLPFTPTLGFNRSRNGDVRAPDRPSLAPGITSYSSITLGRPERWFDPTAFVLPEAGTYGNVGRNVLIGPGVATFDASLFKNTRIAERLNLQFRVEVFNLFNHTNFGLPATNVLNANGTIQNSAGVITSTATSSRQMQFGLKVIW